jgi:hypothetical protein
MSFLHTPFQLDLEDFFARAHELLCILRDRIFTPQRMSENLRMDSELQQENRTPLEAQRDMQRHQILQEAQRNMQREILLNLDIQRARSRVNRRWNSSARVHPMTSPPRAAVPRYVERGWVPPHQTANWYQNGLHY